MKKLSLIVAMACLFMVACTNNSNKDQQTEPTTEQTCDQQRPCPFGEIETLFADWDNMTDEAKAEAVKAAKAKIDEMEANFPKPECKKSCCPKCVEGCCKDGECICENCPCECMKDGKCAKEEGKPCCKPEGEMPCCKGHEGMPCPPKHECGKEGHECDKPCNHPEGEKPCCKGHEGMPKPECMKSCCPKCVEGCCKEGKCICENCPCECCKDGKCNMEEGKPCCKPEMTEEMKAEMEAKKAEMEAKFAEMQENWANFDNLSVDDQKAVIDAKLCMMKHHGGPRGEKHCGQKPCDKPCEKSCEKPCEKSCEKPAE